jgi:tetratricopeptide (TPR) repeat protein/TolB-like protein
VSRPSRRGRVVLAIGAVVGALVAAWTALPRPEPPEPTPGRVAVAPFQYRGAPGLEHTAGAATYLLTANLDGLAGLATVDPQALTVALDRERERTRPGQDPARSAAIALGAQYIVTGSVTRSGELVRVSAAMRDREDDGTAVRATEEGPPEELFSLVDRVTARLFAGRMTDPVDAVIRSAAHTTESFAALAEFIGGETAYRAGRHASASEAFRRAVDMDSTFALAWMRLSQAQNWIVGALPGPAAGEALRHAGRLTAPARRQVEAWHHYQRGQILDAERLYHEMLRSDSASVSAWIALGEIDYHWGPHFGRPPEEARSRWEKALTLDPANVGIMLHLARIAARERRGPDFDDLENEILRRTPPIETKVELSAIRAFTFGTREERESVVEEFRQLPQAARWSLNHSVTSVAWSLADVVELLPVGAPGYQQAVSMRDAINTAHRAGMLLATGRVSWAHALLDTVAVGAPGAIRNFRAATGLVPLVGLDPEGLADLGARIAALPGASLTGADPPSRTLLYLRGALAARAGRHAEALAMADALETREDAVGQDALRLAGLVRAMSLREQGHPEDALAALVEPTRSPPTRLPMIWFQHRAAERFLRAELLAETGRPREALRWFATFPDPTSFDVLYLPAAELRQAELLVRLGQPDAAMSHLRRLEILWQDAEPAAARTLEQSIANVMGNTGEARW